MILKNTLIVLVLLILFYGMWYCYEFVNPWVGILLGIIALAIIADRIIKLFKN